MNHEIVRLPNSLYNEFKSHICCSHICNFEYSGKAEKAPFRADKFVIEYSGQLYLVTGACYSSMERSSFDAYQLVPEELWDGEAYNKRNRSYTGMRVSYKGENFVLSTKTIFGSYLPENASLLSLSEAQAFHKKDSKYGWRSQCEAPKWSVVDGRAIASFIMHGEEVHFIHYRDHKGEICDEKIDSVENLSALVNPVPVMHSSEQLDLF